jgi:hypothetical protein
MNDFERWWYQEGSAFGPVDEDVEEFAKRMCEIAWSNGVFVEREACAKVCEETEVVQTTYCMTLHDEGAETLRNAAAAIRARGT